MYTSKLNKLHTPTRSLLRNSSSSWQEADSNRCLATLSVATDLLTYLQHFLIGRVHKKACVYGHMHTACICKQNRFTGNEFCPRTPLFVASSELTMQFYYSIARYVPHRKSVIIILLYSCKLTVGTGN